MLNISPPGSWGNVLLTLGLCPRTRCPDAELGLAPAGGAEELPQVCKGRQHDLCLLWDVQAVVAHCKQARGGRVQVARLTLPATELCTLHWGSLPAPLTCSVSGELSSWDSSTQALHPGVGQATQALSARPSSCPTAATTLAWTILTAFQASFVKEGYTQEKSKACE